MTNSEPAESKFLLWLGLLLGVFLAAIFLYVDNQDFIDGKTSRGQIVGRDFLHNWTAAKLAADRQFDEIYNPTLLRTHFPEEVSESSAEFYFAYPPHVLTLLRPLGGLDYVPALLVWSVLSVALYVLAATMYSERYCRIWLLILAPTTFLNLSYGQNGLLTGALLIGALRTLETRPKLAGLLIGILSVKPHLGILIPFALVAGRHWTALIWAVISTLGVLSLSTLTLGVEAWQAWFENEPWVYSRTFLEYGTGAGTLMQVSPFMSARLFGADLNIAWLVQVISLALALAVVIVVFLKSSDTLLRLAVLVTSTYLASPYMHNYDMAALSVVVVLLVERGLAKGFEHTERTVLILVWLTPVILSLSWNLIMGIGAKGFPYAPLLMVMLMVMLSIKALRTTLTARL